MTAKYLKRSISMSHFPQISICIDTHMLCVTSLYFGMHTHVHRGTKLVCFNDGYLWMLRCLYIYIYNECTPLAVPAFLWWICVYLIVGIKCHCKIIQWEAPFGSVPETQRAAWQPVCPVFLADKEAFQVSPPMSPLKVRVVIRLPRQFQAQMSRFGAWVHKDMLDVSLGVSFLQTSGQISVWFLSPKESSVAVTRYSKYVAEAAISKQYHTGLPAGYFSFWDLCQTHRHEGSQEAAICLPFIYFYDGARQQWGKPLEKNLKVATRSQSSRKILPNKKLCTPWSDKSLPHWQAIFNWTHTVGLESWLLSGSANSPVPWADIQPLRILFLHLVIYI